MNQIFLGVQFTDKDRILEVLLKEGNKIPKYQIRNATLDLGSDGYYSSELGVAGKVIPKNKVHKFTSGNNLKQENLNHHIQVMAELIRRDKNRPAVVMWSVANEPCTDKPSSVPYFEKLFQETRKLDLTRPVTFVTMYKAWSDKVVKFCDVILCNRYYAWYHDYGQTQLISKQLERELRDWFDTHGKPVVQAEYGADTVAGMHVEPAVMFSEEYQVESLLQYFPVFDKLKKEFFVGEMIWNFADFMTQQGTTRVIGNKKGILTRQRQPKAAAHLLRHRYLNITLEQGGSKTGDELLDTLLRFESHNPEKVTQPFMQPNYVTQPPV